MDAGGARASVGAAGGTAKGMPRLCRGTAVPGRPSELVKAVRPAQPGRWAGGEVEPGGPTGLGESARRGAWALALEGPADSVEGDGGNGSSTGLVKSHKKSKSARVGEEESSENGKEVSSKTTWRDIMILLEWRSRQR